MRTLFLFLLLLVVQVTPGWSDECPFGAPLVSGGMGQAVVTPPMLVVMTV
jgi:hypothetical protein